MYTDVVSLLYLNHKYANIYRQSREISEKSNILHGTQIVEKECSDDSE